MTDEPKMSGWRLFARAIYWNPEPFLGVANWFNFVNIALMFSPWRDAWFHMLFPMAALALCGVSLIRIMRARKRQKAALQTLEKQGGYWATEMAKHLLELELAERRFSTQAEKDEIITRLDEAKTRCEREIAVYQKSIR